MKSALLLLVLLAITSAAYADVYRVKDGLCGEIDPFVIGDACVFTLENKNEELVLITDEDFLYEQEVEIEAGDFVELDKTAISQITDETLRQVRSVLGRHLNYRRGTKFYSLASNDGLIKTELNKTAIQFSCKAEGAGNGFLDAHIKFSGTLNKSQEFSQILDLKFEYKLLDDDSVWSQGQTSYASLMNYMAYRPQVYVGMEKFSFFVSDRVSSGFGDFDIILPANEILSGKKVFNAYVIMTAIDDHHGDTAAVECQAL